MPICISFMVYNVAHVDFAFVNKLLQIYDMVYMRHGVPDVLCSFDKQDNSCLAMKITIVILRVLALVMSWQLVYSGELESQYHMAFVYTTFLSCTNDGAMFCFV